MEYRVVEHFVSINGEGQRAGELAFFIRFAGCNLSCSYCDTAWANQQDVAWTGMTADELAETVRASGVRNVTLTGGEPLLQPELGRLIETLGEPGGIRIEIETNGSVSIEPYLHLKPRPSFTLDYKLPGSGMEAAMKPENYPYLNETDTIKFVISDETDLRRAREVIDAYGLSGKCALYYSPVFGGIEPKRIVEDMIAHPSYPVRLQLQLHKYIWNPETRGV